MTGKQQPTSEFNGDNVPRLARRRFLALAVGATGSAVTSTRYLGGGSAAAYASSNKGEAIRGPAVSGTVYSSLDGLMASYVRGPVHAVESGQVILEMPGGVGYRTVSGPVAVAVLGSTNVHARGLDVQGDVSRVHPGDDLAIGTTLLPSGERVARWMVANMRIGHARVSSIRSPDLYGVNMHRLTQDTGTSVRLTVNPTSRFAWVIPGPVPGVLDMLQFVRPGDMISYVGCLDINAAPSSPSHFWIVASGPYRLVPLESPPA